MDGHELVARYSYITNRLKYCGPSCAHESFLQYVKNSTEDHKTKVREDVKRFEGLYPYLKHIGKKHDLDFLDPKVVEAYWIGNELLDRFTDDDMKDIITDLATRGLPKSYAKKLCRDIPRGMVPHHSFNVIYVGVGKITGSVPTNIENINNCLIRWGVVKKVDKESVVVEHTPYVTDLALGKSKEERFSYLPSITSLREGDTISLHWKAVVDTLTRSQLHHLKKYTMRNVGALLDSL